MYTNHWELINKIKFYGICDQRLTPDEVRFFEGGYYPVLRQRVDSLQWSRWEWKGKESVRHKVQLTVIPALPLKFVGDDAEVLRLTCNYWIPLMGKRIQERTVVATETSHYRLSYLESEFCYDE